jgi:hypothetical protein
MGATSDPIREYIFPVTSESDGLSKQNIAKSLRLSLFGVTILETGPKKRRDWLWAKTPTTINASAIIALASVTINSVFFAFFIFFSISARPRLFL